ncbi:hypothetical protein BOTBODRAFT_178764 [Botryobasidium botryosum FD-172 SS1]|uniref:Uncharacterized protein n=1 Tax=Botryobasidium botryosum (strain FD-172 SS1) TaxID=930990 RepID=A0A067M4P4_BOTB1|nr:hypothetical protein BOTBODRAFT_178764 [Botryobasidium botryosum FD-172 SS1]
MSSAPNRCDNFNCAFSRHSDYGSDTDDDIPPLANIPESEGSDLESQHVSDDERTPPSPPAIDVCHYLYIAMDGNFRLHALYDVACQYTRPIAVGLAAWIWEVLLKSQ